jgi:hypothetical protein
MITLLLPFIPSAVSAQTFCDRLKLILDAEPDFVGIRGAQAGSAYLATASIASGQCVISNQTYSDNKPIDSKWEYDCVWQNRYATSVPWLKQNVQRCYPDAKYADATTVGIKDYPGGRFTLEKVMITFLFDPQTGELRMTIMNPG